jgi:hypothetical protein
VRNGPNQVPGRYREVSVASLPAGTGMDDASLSGYFIGRAAYRRTRFVVARSAGRTALLHVTRASDTELFSQIVGVDVLAGPEECAYVEAPEADTGIPSTLAAVALASAPGTRAVVVQGRYAHVSFVIDPRPLLVTVRDVVPPQPPKLLDQARRVLAVTEDLPPIELVGQLTDLADLIGGHPADHYLLPCRGSGGEVPGARVSYLDDHPEPAEWTLLGCRRSLQIHRWLYGADPPMVDFCPRRPDGTAAPDRLLTKCCLQEEHLEHGPGWVSVPWGSSLGQVQEALALLAAQEEPAWAPV